MKRAPRTDRPARAANPETSRPTKRPSPSKYRKPCAQLQGKHGTDCTCMPCYSHCTCPQPEPQEFPRVCPPPQYCPPPNYSPPCYCRPSPPCTPRVPVTCVCPPPPPPEPCCCTPRPVPCPPPAGPCIYKCPCSTESLAQMKEQERLLKQKQKEMKARDKVCKKECKRQEKEIVKMEKQKEKCNKEVQKVCKKCHKLLPPQYCMHMSKTDRENCSKGKAKEKTLVVRRPAPRARTKSHSPQERTRLKPT